MSLQEEVTCQCVTKHVPLPKRFEIIVINGSTIELCPTTHQNLLSLLDEYEKYGHEPPGSVRKHYSDYVQSLAKQLRD